MKFYLPLFIVLLLGLNLNAQLKDLATIADGDLIHFESIYKKTPNNYNGRTYKLWGYTAVYKKDIINKYASNYEYVFLDKNFKINIVIIFF